MAEDDRAGMGSPPLGFYEKEGNYVLNTEIPGVNKEDLSISLDKKVLTISGKKEKRKEEQGANYYYLQEASFGSFSRSLRLPGEIMKVKSRLFTKMAF
jgi:HSP20 family protein